VSECKRCGCDFPNNEIYETGCIACETIEELFARTTVRFKFDPNKKDKSLINKQLKLVKFMGANK